MNLTTHLRKQGYDLIQGPVRNHGLLQLWLKRPIQDAQLYYSHIDHAFQSPVKLRKRKKQVLSIDVSTQNNYGFYIGMSVMGAILHTLGIPMIDEGTIKSGKNINLSYDQVVAEEVAIGELHNYLSNADFIYPNDRLLKNANRKNILVITGLLRAKVIQIEIESDRNLNTELEAKLTKHLESNMEVSWASENKLVMKTSQARDFPIAVKASHINFDGGQFVNTLLLTDNRHLF